HMQLVCALNSVNCVKCVKVVTQKPSILTEQKGRTVTMDCNIEKDEGYYVGWYKQIPNAAPQFVRFTSNAQSEIDYKLIISNLDVDDSAVYYCHTWDGSAKEYVSQ
uniref:Ig-like domain-containing protein n=2 Tax=Cyprinus carpio TaxID=7962 RepID=A0A9J7WXT2_CYPCA